jgi:hypothetical protein
MINKKIIKKQKCRDLDNPYFFAVWVYGGIIITKKKFELWNFIIKDIREIIYEV